MENGFMPSAFELRSSWKIAQVFPNTPKKNFAVSPYWSQSEGFELFWSCMRERSFPVGRHSHVRESLLPILIFHQLAGGESVRGTKHAIVSLASPMPVPIPMPFWERLHPERKVCRVKEIPGRKWRKGNLWKFSRGHSTQTRDLIEKFWSADNAWMNLVDKTMSDERGSDFSFRSEESINEAHFGRCSGKFSRKRNSWKAIKHWKLTGSSRSTSLLQETLRVIEFQTKKFRKLWAFSKSKNEACCRIAWLCNLKLTVIKAYLCQRSYRTIACPRHKYWQWEKLSDALQKLNIHKER